MDNALEAGRLDARQHDYVPHANAVAENITHIRQAESAAGDCCVVRLYRPVARQQFCPVVGARPTSCLMEKRAA